MKNFLPAACIAVLLAGASQAQAETHHHHNHHPKSAVIAGGGHDHHKGNHNHGPSAPISIMGEHMHKEGEWMLSYRYMRMDMEDNRNGTSDLTPEQVTGFPNFNAPPADLRVVPTDMRMEMHMFGGMYGITDWLTLMGMVPYKVNNMDHITFMGTSGTTRRGTFTTESSGFGDVSVTGLFRLVEEGPHHLHLHAGLSVPTGSIDEEDDVLAPNGMTPTLRLPYAMQLGSGTYDALPGLTYTYRQHDWSLGAQYRGIIRLEDENNNGYSWGDKHTASLWGAYQFVPWLSGSLRLSVEHMGEIDGSDAQITAPVQTADPDNYGGTWVEAGAGFNIKPGKGGHEFGFELAAPLYQDLNGPQLERNFTATAGWQYRF